MTRIVSASRIATLVGDFDRSPAYAGLARALTLPIGDGRIAYDSRLPSERELTEALAVSRTTVTRAYATLRETGYAEARRGAGTFTRVPGGRARAHDRALIPRAGGDVVVDLNCAAPPAPVGLAEAYAEAADELPAYLGGHGYFPVGLPDLQRAIAATYDARGLPTDPDQVMVTSGALAAASVVAQAFTRTGDRLLVESPVYPNATDALRHAGARLTPVPVDPEGWDLDAVAAMIRQTSPRLAYLIPDFQNPTGHLMSDAQREEYAGHLRRAHATPIVDEAHQALALDGQEMPRPFAAYAPETITLGSASKAFWGGLRLGWIRAPRAQMERLTQARISLDLGAPVMEQLVLVRLLAHAHEILPANRDVLRTQRDVLVAAVREHLPEWTFRVPSGGLALWCHLPASVGSALAAEAERHGVAIVPGPVFAVEGGLDSFVRIPWGRRPEELVEGVRRIAAAWDVVRERPASSPGPSGRVMVA